MNNIHILMAKTPNFGDTLNLTLISLISGRSVIPMNKFDLNLFKSNEPIYSCIGSILGWSTEQIEVWGSGFISNIKPTIPHPKAIHAVRGVLTRDLLIQNGYKCPEVYGDPALLMPRYFNPDFKKRYDLSIIPHHVDKALIPEIVKEYPQAHIIDIQQSIYGFLSEVIQSKYIISSALHGLISADAYKIPNEHVKFSNNVLGNDFKFNDYKETKPYVNLNKLLEVCPFKK